MAYDTSSFRAFVHSLEISTPVTHRAGRIIAGPPVPVLDLALRLGFGPLIFDTPRNRALMESIGVPAEITAQVARRLRRRTLWREVWEAAAAPHVVAADELAARGDHPAASAEIRLALVLLGMAYGGDNYYFYTPIPTRRAGLATRQRLYTSLRDLTGQKVERLTVRHARGTTAALLHLPSHPTGRVPALVGIHPLGSDKDNFDFVLGLFRDAGYATLCIDLPAHGDNLDGARLRPDDEAFGVAALEALAARPEVNPARLGLLGASLGGFFALRTAAASPLAKVCVVFASGFDIGFGLPQAVFGIQDQLRWAMGAPDLPTAFEMAKPFHLRDVISLIRCPVLMVHGTQDHICDFTVPYEVARRLKAPLTIKPLIGADHEVAIPSTPALAGPALEWLRENL